MATPISDSSRSEFDVVFAYPWPDEEELTAQLFEQFARPGALLVSYHNDEDVTVRRKVSRKKKWAVGYFLPFSSRPLFTWGVTGYLALC